MYVRTDVHVRLFLDVCTDVWQTNRGTKEMYGCTDVRMYGCTYLMYKHGTRKHLCLYFHVHVSFSGDKHSLFYSEQTEVERIKSMQHGAPTLRCCWVILQK